MARMLLNSILQNNNNDSNNSCKLGLQGDKAEKWPTELARYLKATCWPAKLVGLPAECWLALSFCGDSAASRAELLLKIDFDRAAWWLSWPDRPSLEKPAESKNGLQERHLTRRT